MSIKEKGHSANNVVVQKFANILSRGHTVRNVEVQAFVTIIDFGHSVKNVEEQAFVNTLGYGQDVKNVKEHKYVNTKEEDTIVNTVDKKENAKHLSVTLLLHQTNTKAIVLLVMCFYKNDFF